MCVIMLGSKQARPTDEMVKRAFDSNPHGAGIAWREQDANGVTEVVWEKGLDLDEVLELVREVPTPFVVHFRIASVGGIKPSLTHPFVVSKTAPLALQGRTKGAVLFHNGHWHNWTDRALEMAMKTGVEIPAGDWSDTRAMAWMVSIVGPGLMEFLTTQKGVYMTPSKIDIFTGPGWDKVNGVYCSNDSFWIGRHNSVNTTYRRLCHVGKCHNQAQKDKDICESCEKERTPNIDDSEEHTQSGTTTASVEQTGGNTGVIIPATVGPRTSLDMSSFKDRLTLAQAETIYKAKGMSHNMYKKFKKEYFHTGGNNANREAKAWREILELSRTVKRTLSSTGGIS